MILEVPGHVVHENQVQNSVQVQGGTNWDLSRSAVTTPIAPLMDPEPRRVGSAECDCTYSRKGSKTTGSHSGFPRGATIQFSKNSVILSSTAQKALRQIPRDAIATVAGYADTTEKGPDKLADKRAEAVAAYLKKHGVHVSSIKSSGTGSNRGVSITTP